MKRLATSRSAGGGPPRAAAGGAVPRERQAERGGGPPLVCCAQVMLITQVPAVFIYRRKVILSVGHYAALLPLQVRVLCHCVS